MTNYCYIYSNTESKEQVPFIKQLKCTNGSGTVERLYRQRRRGQGARVPQKFWKNFFSNYYVKVGHFSDKNHVKLGNCVIFFGQIS